MSYTDLENRVIDRMEFHDFMEITSSDMYMICKNICNGPGECASQEQIDEEIECYYNN